MTKTELECEDCGSPAPKGGLAVDESGDTPGVDPDYCSNCGAGPDPWEDRAVYDFERDVSLPYVFSVQVGNDDWGLWRAFCYDVWGTEPESGKAVANWPEDFPRMKYNITHLYYKLDEDLELNGPFLDKSAARKS